MRKVKETPFCSRKESVQAAVLLGNTLVPLSLPALSLALVLGTPWERVKKRRQRGFSWSEALHPMTRPKGAFNQPDARPIRAAPKTTKTSAPLPPCTQLVLGL